MRLTRPLNFDYNPQHLLEPNCAMKYHCKIVTINDSFLYNSMVPSSSNQISLVSSFHKKSQMLENSSTVSSISQCSKSSESPGELATSVYHHSDNPHSLAICSHQNSLDADTSTTKNSINSSAFDSNMNSPSSASENSTHPSCLTCSTPPLRPRSALSLGRHNVFSCKSVSSSSKIHTSSILQGKCGALQSDIVNSMSLDHSTCMDSPSSVSHNATDSSLTSFTPLRPTSSLSSAHNCISQKSISSNSKIHTSLISQDKCGVLQSKKQLCPYCSECYSHKSSLSRHVKKVHGMIGEKHSIFCSICSGR